MDYVEPEPSSSSPTHDHSSWPIHPPNPFYWPVICGHHLFPSSPKPSGYAFASLVQLPEFDEAVLANSEGIFGALCSTIHCAKNRELTSCGKVFTDSSQR